jgi:hypothetical protein
MSSSRPKDRIFLPLLILLSIGCLNIVPLFSQDANYWTHQYGTRATLLGGAVIGSVLDLSGAYYNPGGLGLIEKPAILEAAKVFQNPNIILKGYGQDYVNFSTSTLEPAPSLLAGTISLKGLENHRFGYSFLARQNISTGLIGSFLSSRDVLSSPGTESVSSNLRLNIKLTESWFGLTWAYKIKKKIGIGVSPYLLVRNHNASIQTLAQALTSDGDISLVINGREYSYVNYRFLWKIGVAFDFDRITLGLTVTTPSFKIYGRGSTGLNRTVVGLDLNDDKTKDDFLASDHQGKLAANYKTPFSLGIGLTYKFDNFRMYGSAEWFSGIAKYDVMRGKDFTMQSSGEIKSVNVTQEIDHVLNFGIGIEYIFTTKFKSYASFSTDFSAVAPDSDANYSLSSWDIYHTMAGADFTLGHISLTLGIGYAFGKHITERFIEEEKRAAREFLENTLFGLKYEYSSIKFIIGFAF